MPTVVILLVLVPPSDEWVADLPSRAIAPIQQLMAAALKLTKLTCLALTRGHHHSQIRNANPLEPKKNACMDIKSVAYTYFCQCNRNSISLYSYRPGLEAPLHLKQDHTRLQAAGD